MTHAICAKCGASNIGDFLACQKCGFAPHRPEDRENAIALSDQNLTTEQLEIASARIQRGEHPELQAAELAKVARAVDRFSKIHKMPLGCAIAVWTPVVVMILLAVVLARTLAYLKFH